MKIKELLTAVSALVQSRKTIDHGSIRMLWDEQAAADIAQAEDCDDVDTGTIGSDELAAELSDIAEDGDRIAALDLDDLIALERAFRRDDLESYLQHDKEDELTKLDALIEAAKAVGGLE